MSVALNMSQLSGFALDALQNAMKVVEKVSPMMGINGSLTPGGMMAKL